MTDNLRAMVRHQPSAGPVALRTDNLDTMTVAKLLAGSGFFGEVREQGQALAKILAGAELGIGPIASLMGIYYQKGRLSFSANIMAAIVKRSGRYTYRVKRLENDGCTIEFFEGNETIGTSSFTAEDAKSAQLTDGNWVKFRRNMMFARAMSNGCKWFCPDVFGGTTPYTPDEIGPAVMSDDGSMRPIDAEAVEVQPGWTAAPVERELCDAEHYNRLWHATVKGTRFEADDVRHKFIAYVTKDRFDSLAEYLGQATEAEADWLVASVKTRIEIEARQQHTDQDDARRAAVDRDDARDDRQARPISLSAKLEAAVIQARMLGSDINLPADYRSLPDEELQAALDTVCQALEAVAAPA